MVTSFDEDLFLFLPTLFHFQKGEWALTYQVKAGQVYCIDLFVGLRFFKTYKMIV